MASWKRLCARFQTENERAIVECCDPESFRPMKLTNKWYASVEDTRDFARLDLAKLGAAFDGHDDWMTDRRRGYRIAKGALLFYTQQKAKKEAEKKTEKPEPTRSG